jgi:hypothetical protein|tara:strand:- start:1459 stop:1728 length:270 start_codon:yes stop_codon:yes gene_type:complete
MTSTSDPLSTPEHEPFELQDRWLPHWTYLVKGMALFLTSLLLTTAAILGIIWHWYIFPFSISCIAFAVFSFWGALIQISGGTLLADHEF